ncbi:electron transfer flavoprotein subunit beta/FixA family protein [Microbacterium capsulatum]|uniref:Electron transfer flavoprotein subunit beta/FixA family protein n=1 Tax=Microbacterium capsulatum TaxID=3041921 RepID=A0ABU0XIT9_9MICO|nr:electron transfer flavoprotein subunit beta/FixA family protein [Microbacterium sp. ASV81]MDQ4214488.1 electron transfer flavoprotein subunit beta/FixA family protein [Microbacterium sp. ASV81]
MKIVVLVKEVPDTYGERTLSLETGLADRGASEAVIDEIGERALEVALAHADAVDGVEVSILTVGPDSATTSIRKGLAMGAGTATHVADPALVGADLGLTAEVIAAALRADGWDLVIAGNQSTDGTAGMLPAMVAELLAVPVLTDLGTVAIETGAVSGTRAGDEAVMQVRAELPAVISITEQLPDARFANFKGIMAAKKKPIAVKTLGDLGIDAEDMTASRAIMIGISARPPRQAGVKVVDDGSAVAQLTSFLIENRLV